MPYNYPQLYNSYNSPNGQYMYQNPYQQPQSYSPNTSNAQNMSSTINWVQGEIGAKAYPVAPGNSVQLMDSDAQYFYIKSADGTGMPTLRKYAYYEVVDEPVVAHSGATSDEIDTSYFADREDVKKLQDELKSVKDELEKLKKGAKKPNDKH